MSMAGQQSRQEASELQALARNLALEAIYTTISYIFYINLMGSEKPGSKLSPHSTAFPKQVLSASAQ